MTSLAFVFGVLPLALAMGAGANARHSIGTGIIGGMIGETTLAMLYVPLFFYLFERLARAREGRSRSRPKLHRGRAGRRAEMRRLRSSRPRSSSLGRLHDGAELRAGRRWTLPPAYRYEEKDAQATANTAWWKQFEDPVLDGLIAEALANNLNVQIAAANVEQAAAVLTQTTAPLYPAGRIRRLGSAGAWGANRTPRPIPPTVPNPQTSYQTLAGASWEIDLWGRIRRLSEAARAEPARPPRRPAAASSSPSSRPSPRRTSSSSASTSSSRSRSARSATYAESVRLFELQFSYGQVSQMTVEQARTQYETAAAVIPQIASRSPRRRTPSRSSSGATPAPIPRGKTIDDARAARGPRRASIGSPGEPARHPAGRAESRSPPTRRSARPRRSTSRRISLTGAFGSASADLSNLFKGPALTWSYAGSLTGPIFAGGAIRAQVRQAEAGTKAALLGYEASIQSAFADVENALAGRPKLVEQVDAQRRLVQGGREYERLARLQFDGGYAPYSTVLQAQQQLFPAELN